MKIAITVLGYVGLSNAVLLAQHNEVVAIDIAADKVAMLNKKQSPIEEAEKLLLPLQAGDVPDTYADVVDLFEQFHYKPANTVE
jgi:UDP-N-acetyl-D-mannosaminuronate dehydrogenase